MNNMKKTLVSMLALVTACGMLTTAAMAEEAPADAAAEAVAEAVVEEAAAEAVDEAVAEAAVEAAVQADPVEGSWVLNEVYEVKEGAEPALLKKEENASLYGAGISVFTFDADGAGHLNTIDGADQQDKEATWATTEPGVYTFTEGSDTTTLTYDLEKDVLHRTVQEDGRTLDFVYARGFVGSWTLDQVLEIHDGDAPTPLSKEENASLYGAGEAVVKIFSDGTVNEEITDGADKTTVEGTWKLDSADIFTYTVDGLDMTFNYFRADDTIIRDFHDDTEGAEHAHLHFIYKRVVPAPAPAAAETATTAAAQDKNAATQPTTKAADQNNAANQNGAEDELINGGQIFTGFVQPAYDPDTLQVFELKELSQGGYANDATGIVYTPEGGGGEHLYGSDGSVLLMGSPDDYADENELINGGQIFTGFVQVAYDPDTLEIFELKELSQGGYANDATGVTFSAEGGGGDHLYGSDGSVLLMGTPDEYGDDVVDDDVDDYVEDDDDIVDDED